MREQLIQYRPLESNSLYQIVLSSSNTRKLKIIFANATTCFFFTNYCTVAQPSKTGLLSVLAPRWEIEQKRPGVIFRLYITKLELKKKKISIQFRYEICFRLECFWENQIIRVQVKLEFIL